MSEQVRLSTERNEMKWISWSANGWLIKGSDEISLNGKSVSFDRGQEKCGLLRTWKTISVISELTSTVTTYYQSSVMISPNNTK